MSITGVRVSTSPFSAGGLSELRNSSLSSSHGINADTAAQFQQSHLLRARDTSRRQSYSVAGLPDIFSTKIDPAPSGRSTGQIYKDFFGLDEVPKPSRYSPAMYWGTVSVAPSTRELSRDLDSGAFEREHAGIKLPNVKDDATMNACVRPEELREYKDMAVRAANVGRVVYPQGTRLMRHYLDASGKPLETVVSKKFFDTSYSGGSKGQMRTYIDNLERSALRYAMDNPQVKRFTIQGPLLSSLPDFKDRDMLYAVGSFWAGGRAHYTVTRSEGGKVLLTGQTQRFGFDYYNFRAEGTPLPTLPGEKQGSIPQGMLQSMAICDDPSTGRKMAAPFFHYLKDSPEHSRVSNY